jgi:hypothetical protein
MSTESNVISDHEMYDGLRRRLNVRTPVIDYPPEILICCIQNVFRLVNLLPGSFLENGALLKTPVSMNMPIEFVSSTIPISSFSLLPLTSQWFFGGGSIIRIHSEPEILAIHSHVLMPCYSLSQVEKST